MAYTPTFESLRQQQLLVPMGTWTYQHRLAPVPTHLHLYRMASGRWSAHTEVAGANPDLLGYSDTGMLRPAAVQWLTAQVRGGFVFQASHHETAHCEQALGEMLAKADPLAWRENEAAADQVDCLCAFRRALQIREFPAMESPLAQQLLTKLGAHPRTSGGLDLSEGRACASAVVLADIAESLQDRELDLPAKLESFQALADSGRLLRSLMSEGLALSLEVQLAAVCESNPNGPQRYPLAEFLGHVLPREQCGTVAAALR